MGRGGKLAGGLWRVGLYIRLSRDDGREESLSVQNQRKILLDYLEHEFQGQWELAGIYVDDGLTGTDDSRESFQRMIGDMKAGKLNCIVCKTLPGLSELCGPRLFFGGGVSPLPHPVYLPGQSPGGQLFGPRGGADGAGNSHQWDSQ